MLRIIGRRAQASGATNVIPVLGSLTDPNLPDSSVDVALIVDAYHEFSHPLEMMEALVRDLKAGGIVILVEYRGEDPTLDISPLHKMTEEQARREMEAVGLSWQDTRAFLPRQHFTIFRRPH